MNLYLDTEFNGFGGELISMGIVSSDSREFYEVMELPESIHPWVEENVVPILGKKPISFEEFGKQFRAYLIQFKEPNIVIDWFSDGVHFLNMFAGRDHSRSIMYPCTIQLRNIPEYNSSIPHNALYDARAIRDYCEGVDNSKEKETS